jgi:hypothetical protein
MTNGLGAVQKLLGGTSGGKVCLAQPEGADLEEIVSSVFVKRPSLTVLSKVCLVDEHSVLALIPSGRSSW